MININSKVLFVWLLLISVSAKAGDLDSKALWLPKSNVFPSLLFDTQEARTGGSLYGFRANDRWQNRGFGNFSVGFRRNIIRWHDQTAKQRELGFELAVNTQFIFEKPFELFQVNLFSVDFKVGLHYQWQLNNNIRLRARIYHVSSHLGDDFIYRYFITHFLDNPRIFEVIDLSAAYQLNHLLFYANLGLIPHSAYERKPLIVQAGTQWESAVKGKNWLKWLAGFDVRAEQESAFHPGLHLGAGLRLGMPDAMPFTVMIDYYAGYIPHSLFDRANIQWVGASLLFHPF
ncbi:MAG: DUF1207 domain-containing protein [Bacteroidales bacterium]|nr:DUF1207 domain-containing protein [Bacteroidales bacterium]